MRTRSLMWLVGGMAVVAVVAWWLLSDSDGALYNWFASLHGRPSGGH